MIAWSIAAAIGLIALGVVIYNRLIALSQRGENAFSDIDVQLKRRWDLVPALIETVRGYAGHEHEVLAEVVAARGQAMAAEGEQSGAFGRGERETGLALALRDVFVLVEDYPALKADRNFLALHQSLVTIEDDLQHERRYYNAVIRDFNTLRQSFPANLVGAAAGLAPGEFFQIKSEQRAVPVADLAASDFRPGE